MSYQDLKLEFNAKNIPFNIPSFYDHENFIEEEKKDSKYLNKYSEFVASRPYGKEYLSKTNINIRKIAKILLENLLHSNRQGACLDISSILVRILELEGIWCACLKGGCSVTFPRSSKEGNAHFYSVTKGLGTAGHYWVYAPPFKIIDLSIRAQPYDGNKIKYLPNIILEKNTATSTMSAEDIINPDIILDYMHNKKIPKDKQINHFCPEIHQVQRHFPPQIVKTSEGANIKYSATATHASTEKLEDFGNFDFNGMTPYELYKKIIQPGLI